MTEESTLSEDGLAKRIADFAASFAANQKALADLAQIGNPNMVAMLAEAALSDRGDGFACYVAENMVAIRASALRSEEVCTVLVMGYELGISVGSAACMNDLGALCYMGELVPQDYARAAKLYEQAMDHGCFQSIINLGYIYEYGRTGEADHQKAYHVTHWLPLCSRLVRRYISWGICILVVRLCHLAWGRLVSCGSAVSNLLKVLLKRLSHLCESLRQSSTPHAKSGEKNTTPSVRCLCFSRPKLGCV